MAIVFRKIDHPNMHGWTARVGERAVEVVRLYEGEWAIFRAIGGKAVVGVLESMTHEQAMKTAREFLESTTLLETWSNATDIGCRVQGGRVVDRDHPESPPEREQEELR